MVAVRPVSPENPPAGTARASGPSRGTDILTGGAAVVRQLGYGFFLTGLALLGLAGYAGRGPVGAEEPRPAAKAPAAAEDPADGNLSLRLPESADPPEWATDRVSKLTVDGKDFSPRGAPGGN